MKKISLLLLSIVICMGAYAQDNKSKNFPVKVKISGFIKNDFFYDTRAVVAARDDHFLLWPANESLDANGNDINAKGSIQMLSIQSRLKIGIKGPDAFGAKTSGVLEADYFGSTNGNINTLRLRHAFVKLSWTNAELLLGQYWNPMFQGKCYPTTVSFNSGAGIMPFARNPQIRFSYSFGGLKLIATAFSERDHVSYGINNGYSTEYIRNSGMPAFNGQIHYAFGGETKVLVGASASYMSILPQQVTSANIITSEKLNSMSALAFLRIDLKPVTIKLSAVYGENMVNTLSFGGFGIKDTIDAVTKEVSYTPLTNGSIWADFNTTGKKVQFGLFAGINMNLGAKDDVIGGLYGRATNIGQVYRVSPRIVFISGKVRLAVELEISGADYGDGTYDIKGIPLNTKTFTNYRILTSAAYFF